MVDVSRRDKVLYINAFFKASTVYDKLKIG
jgi:hypothetical protein